MSSASPASSQVRHGAAAAPAVQAAMRAVPAYAFISSDVDNEFKLNLGDIPRLEQTMDVEGLKPSLLSRLLELVAPTKA
jgi:hypothetical protein